MIYVKAALLTVQADSIFEAERAFANFEDDIVPTSKITVALEESPAFPEEV